MNQESVAYVHYGISWSSNKEQSLTIATTWMEPKDIMLSEVSLKERDSYKMITLICGTYRYTGGSNKSQSNAVPELIHKTQFEGGNLKGGALGNGAER